MVYFVFYGDLISFVYSLSTWTSQGGHWRDGIITGVFAFRCWIGGVDNLGGSRLVIFKLQCKDIGNIKG